MQQCASLVPVQPPYEAAIYGQFEISEGTRMDLAQQETAWKVYLDCIRGSLQLLESALHLAEPHVPQVLHQRADLRGVKGREREGEEKRREEMR